MERESVLCIETRILKEKTKTQGFIPVSQLDLSEMLQIGPVWFAPRSVIEYDPGFRQIIPYIILKKSNSLLMYKRSIKGKEKRLHEQLSIGLGGHVELKDIVKSKRKIDFMATLRKSALREIKEEVFLPLTLIDTQQIIGYINDISTAVGRVHFGVVEVWTITDTNIKSTEESISDCRFISYEKLSRYKSKMESWSRLCVGQLRHNKPLHT
ncbi:MAG: hypothetical protein ACLQF0_11505 [Dissulfurispiraceae bacterium]